MQKSFSPKNTIKAALLDGNFLRRGPFFCLFYFEPNGPVDCVKVKKRIWISSSSLSQRSGTRGMYNSMQKVSKRGFGLSQRVPTLPAGAAYERAIAT